MSERPTGYAYDTPPRTPAPTSAVPDEPDLHLDHDTVVLTAPGGHRWPVPLAEIAEFQVREHDHAVHVRVGAWPAADGAPRLSIDLTLTGDPARLAELATRCADIVRRFAEPPGPPPDSRPGPPPGPPAESPRPAPPEPIRGPAYREMGPGWLSLRPLADTLALAGGDLLRPDGPPVP